MKLIPYLLTFLLGALTAAMVLHHLSPSAEKVVVSDAQTTATIHTVIHKHISIVKPPDANGGTVITEDVIETADESSIQDTKSTVLVDGRQRATMVSALAATDIHDITKVVYGVSVAREVLGPVTVGAFGLSSGVFGVSLGVRF